MEPEISVSAKDSRATPAPATDDPWIAMSGLQCQLSVAVQVEGFKVRDLLALDVESVISSRASASDPVAVWVNGVTVGLAEFDVLGSRVAIRMSELQ
ncbi:MAG: FliM/FliN family flagellar motor switch protein [Terriglobia bacterium]